MHKSKYFLQIVLAILTLLNIIWMFRMSLLIFTKNQAWVFIGNTITSLITLQSVENIDL